MDPTFIHIIHAVLLLLLILPGVWLVTKGHRLQYAVIWLAIFTALSWGYQVFAPDQPTRFDRIVSDRQSYFNRGVTGDTDGEGARVESPNNSGAGDFRPGDIQPESGDGLLTPSDRVSPRFTDQGDNI